jgi:hypothetical protein
MERVELLTGLEQQHGKRVAPEARAAIFTVMQLVTAVETASLAGEPPEPGATAGAEPGGGCRGTACSPSPTDPRVVAALARPTRLRASILFAIIRIATFVTRGFVRFRCSGLERLPANGPTI